MKNVNLNKRRGNYLCTLFWGDEYPKGGVMFFLYKKSSYLGLKIEVNRSVYDYLPLSFKIVKNYYSECTWKLYISQLKWNNKLSKSCD